jgi:hypothetical protein
LVAVCLASKARQYIRVEDRMQAAFAVTQTVMHLVEFLSGVRRRLQVRFAKSAAMDKCSAADGEREDIRMKYLLIPFIAVDQHDRYRTP